MLCKPKQKAHPAKISMKAKTQPSPSINVCLFVFFFLIATFIVPVVDIISINNSFPLLAAQWHQLGPLKHYTRWPTAPLWLNRLVGGPTGSRGRLEGLEMGTSEKKKEGCRWEWQKDKVRGIGNGGEREQRSERVWWILGKGLVDRDNEKWVRS